MAHTPALPDALNSLMALSGNVPGKGFRKLLASQEPRSGPGTLSAYLLHLQPTPADTFVCCSGSQLWLCLPPSPPPNPDPFFTLLRPTPNPGADIHSHLDGLPCALGLLVSSWVRPMEIAAGRGGRRRVRRSRLALVPSGPITEGGSTVYSRPQRGFSPSGFQELLPPLDSSGLRVVMAPHRYQP